ncbi:nucleotidyltransferase family protein [Halioglobus maricola]|uniref:Nucleotidyltransferase family protein n=1 Tax=Halioglobus maricola TaxID=2601894 RepID=A0A5P9NNF5_9GAMM|nr:nucleotidyltransferase family protein [Halioglobus maricola]QFU76448.1 nucleotidyltransferase family protein [Halioglobus maricola]
MNVGILILAAGSSRRFGSDKRRVLLPNGKSLLQQSVDNALASGLSVAVAIREGEDSMVNGRVSALNCPDAHLGMGHTLAQGVAQLPRWEGVLIALGDMPGIRPATFCNVAELIRPEVIGQPVYRGKPGHPVGFSSTFFAALENLDGDSGARALLKQNREAIVRLPVDDPGILKDVDTVADLPGV